MAQLVIFRHGQSVWNLENRFTGGADIGLTLQGKEEARLAGLKLRGHQFGFAYASAMKRARQTLAIALDAAEITPVSTVFHKALNERDYGDLQGLDKSATALKYGQAQVRRWSHGYDTAPPNGETLRNTAGRVTEFFKAEIAPKLKNNINIVIAAHCHSLRALVMFLENLSPQQIAEIDIDTAKPLEYVMDNELKIISRKDL